MRRIRPTLAGAALTLALAAGGLTATASPASADTFGRLTIGVKGHIVDEDSPDADDICDRTFTMQQAVEIDQTSRQLIPLASLSCDEARVQFSSFGWVNPDGGVQVDFNATYDDRECWTTAGCFWAIAGGTRTHVDIWADTSETRHVRFRKSGTMRVDMDVTYRVDS
jgi:hypothetical protein